MFPTIHNEYLTVTAAAKGAELQSIRGADGTEYLWQGDSRYWSDRALNIFPYVARLTQGLYEMDGQRHQMAIHGFAPYEAFRLVSNDGQTMVLELPDNDRTWAQYPRHFAFRVIYTLRKNVLHITYEVENRDERPLYFGLGGHPGFNIPLVPGTTFEDYRLRFGSPCHPQRIIFDEDCFVTGERRPYELQDGRIINLRHDLFDEDAIVLTDMDREITLEAPGDAHSVTVTFPQMAYLGLWHWPKTDAPYVCIEPWCSLPARAGRIAVFEEQEDLIALAPGQTYRNCWTISIT